MYTRQQLIIAIVILLSVYFVPELPATVIHVPADYQTIQQAIDASVNGDEIIVASGTYYEAITFKGSAIYIHSSGGSDVTIIDATGLDTSVITCTNGAGSDYIIDGFTLTGGTGTFYKYGDYGGGMFCRNSSPTIRNCIFRDNVAYHGAGFFNDDASSPIISGCKFINNIADNSGGGIFNDAGTMEVIDCDFTSNTAYNGGGGIYSGPDGSIIINACAFKYNYSDGGAGMSANGSNAIITDSLFQNNFSYRGSGALSTSDGTEIYNTVFEGNIAQRGGGIGINSIGKIVTISNCSLIDNLAFDSGGGIFVDNGLITVTNTIFSDNEAGRGGGVDIGRDASTTFIDCTLTQNYADYGGGISYADGTKTHILTNCTIANNYAAIGGGIVSDIQIDVPILSNCILWGDNGREISGEVTATYCNIERGYPGEGNIEVDPLFLDPDNGNFQLSQGSPCIDAGDNSALPPEIITDLNGNPRYIDDPFTIDTGKGDPPVIDMGEYEYQVPTLSISPDPLIAGLNATFTVTSACPNTKTYLAYSLRGTGSIYVPFLNVTLDLIQPNQAGDMIISDADGFAEWILHIPNAGAGRNVWLQVCQFELKTNVVATSID